MYKSRLFGRIEIPDKYKELIEEFDLTPDMQVDEAIFKMFDKYKELKKENCQLRFTLNSLDDVLSKKEESR